MRPHRARPAGLASRGRRSSYPRLAGELERDRTGIDDEFTEALHTVLRGAELSSCRAAPNP
jgi:hypothetical protein